MTTPSSSLPLAGRRVVTTRERPGELDRALEAAGAEPVNIPLIELVAARGGELARALSVLDRFDWLIVTSQFAAELVGAAAASHPLVSLAAVGRHTAEVLGSLAGRLPEIVPERQTAADLVRAMPEPGERRRVLVPQADRADSTLVEGLRQRGYAVTAVTAYHTSLRTPNAEQRRDALTADAVAFASGSAATAWVSAFGTAAPPVVAAIGPTTAAAAERLGLVCTHVAEEHSIAGLVAAVVSALIP
jgi:uroporphyrinogen-III synthase